MTTFNPISQCHGKAAYFTQRDAAEVAKSAANHGRGKMKPYRCPHCSTPGTPRWHIGHRPIRKRKPKRDAT